jgi:hypothetical protein
MARGARCPACGELKFQEKKAVRVCSNCGVVGWVGKPGKPGGGKGSQCNLCGEQMRRKIATLKGANVYHCYGCEATYMK